MPRQSIAEFLDDFSRHGHQIAYVQRRGYRTERWSYHDVAACAFQTAREVEARNINKGDRVLLWAPNSAEWIAAFFACALTGAIAVPMDDSAAPAFVRRVCAQVNARFAFCSREHAGDFPGVPLIILEALRTEVDRHSAAPIPTPTSHTPSDPLEIIFTSGTTTDPKGVVLTHANVLANLAPLETEIQKYLKYERCVHPVRFLNLLPLSHVFGQFLGIFLPPLLAATVVFQEALGPSEVIATIRRERVSVLVAVPRMLQSLKEKILRDAEEFKRSAPFHKALNSAAHVHFLRRWWVFRRIHRQFGWKFWAMISGGAALDGETEEFWGRLGYAIIQGYGLTETTSLISLNHPFHLGKGSIGKVLPGREVKLADDGEILVRGGGVASGYWTNSGSSNEVSGTEVADKDGWYRTGDIGALDEAGNLYFKGRKKEVLVTPAGMNIYPEDLEAALRQQPEVRDCVIIAREIGGNAEPCAVLLLRDSKTDPEPILRRANATLAEYQRMRSWFVWPEADFPRTATQKPKTSIIRDAALAKLGARSSNAASAAVANPSSTASPLAELITRVSGRNIATLSPLANLEDDLQLSSLERVELMSALEDRYQLDLSETAFSSARTVADLQQVLTENAGERLTYSYPRWALHWPATWLRFLAHYTLMRPSILLLGWPRIEGRENLRGLTEPLLIVCNHLDDVDPGFVLTALPARYRHRLAVATGGETLQSYRTPPTGTPLFKRFYLQFKWLLAATLLNLFPLPRAAGFQKSFAYAGECIDQGYSVLVFPEGQHTKDGHLLPFRAGVGLLAKQLNVPVLPMRIDGLFEVKQSGRKFAAPFKIRVRIGKPVRFEPEADPHSIAQELQQQVAALPHDKLADGKYER
jgi:long-chain acyl-CoA synthetase